MLRLRGIIPPIVTPLTEDERVDEAALARQAKRLVDAGVHGIFVLGTTGEQPALRPEERARAIRTVVAAVGDRVPVIAGCMAASTTLAIENLHQAAVCGAKAGALTPPYYYGSRGPAEQVAHYRACAAASPIPLLIYNIPATTKVMLSPAVTREVAALPEVIGIKDSSGDFGHFLQLLDDLRDDPEFALFVGSPALAGAAILYGADGAVPGLANLDPVLLVAIYEAAVARDLDRLIALQTRLHRLARIVGYGAGIACLKVALEWMGIGRAHVTRPIEPVASAGREAIGRLLRELELLP